ncbi:MULTISPECIES: hypothetical protein [Streptomyces]|uniref:Secreted protein n=1 Tax=Streptomyces bangladeshensis TaxID=295352 RepID=A0ABN3BAV6_9ACTN|nr:putative secreted protein [Streptomyces sp. EAS-AB2608]CUW29006.1 hypothetical protein TUE45_03742 [Streptomyces reticuli]
MLRHSGRHSGGHRAPQPRRGGRDPRRLRLLGLTGVVAAVVALPLTVASAGQVGDAGRAAAPAAARDAADDRPDTVRRSPFLLGQGLATAVRCGPELTSPDGIEAQTCVLTQGEDTWARTYYRNATGASLDSVLSLMGPGGRTVQMRCTTGADDEPATCETPRERSRGGPDAYTAVTEFAERGADGALLLRSGSNS